MTPLPWFQRPIEAHAVAEAYLAWLHDRQEPRWRDWKALDLAPVQYHHNPIDGQDAMRAVRPRR